MKASRKLKWTLLQFLSFFSVIRGYNIAVVVIAQYLSAIFIFGSHSRAITVLTDVHLFLIIFSSALAIASGYIINNFYDDEKDLINRPYKSFRSEEHTSELQSRPHLVCRLLLEKKKNNKTQNKTIKK